MNNQKHADAANTKSDAVPRKGQALFGHCLSGHGENCCWDTHRQLQGDNMAMAGPKFGNTKFLIRHKITKKDSLAPFHYFRRLY